MGDPQSFFSPATLFANLFDAAVFFAIYGILKARTKSYGSPSFKYWQSYFLNMGLFVSIVSLPHLWLLFAPEQFLAAAKWALSFGRLFLLLAVASTARLLALFIWEQKTKLIYTTWLLLGCIIFILNIIYPSAPVFGHTQKMLINNAHPIIGITMPIYVSAIWIPLAILFIRSGIKNKKIRTRSFLLAAGLITQSISGPLQGYANSPQLIILSVIFTTISGTLILAGILYKARVE